jgi:hypothetical protein
MASSLADEVTGPRRMTQREPSSAWTAASSSAITTANSVATSAMISRTTAGLAVPTGQGAEFPADVAETALEASRMVVTDKHRVGRFGPEQPAPGGAWVTQQLVGFLGRSA